MITGAFISQASMCRKCVGGAKMTLMLDDYTTVETVADGTILTGTMSREDENPCARFQIMADIMRKHICHLMIFILSSKTRMLVVFVTPDSFGQATQAFHIEPMLEMEKERYESR